MIAMMAVLLAMFGEGAAAQASSAKEIVIPVVGRVDGAGGAAWRTDLVIANVSVSYQDEMAVELRFADGDSTKSAVVKVRPQQVLFLRDFVKTTFGLESGLGMLRVILPTSDSQFSVRAYIYDETRSASNDDFPPATAGEVTPLSLGDAALNSIVPGLGAYRPYRGNIGIANPGSEVARVNLTVRFDVNFNFGWHHVGSYELKPSQVIQVPVPFAFAVFNAQVSSDRPVFAFGSMIHSEGATKFVPGMRWRTSADFVIPPACASPAPIISMAMPFEGASWIVQFHPGVDARVEAPRLAAKHGFTPRSIFWQYVSAFSSDMSPEALAGVRCEPTVKHIEEDSYFSVGP